MGRKGKQKAQRDTGQAPAEDAGDGARLEVELGLQEAADVPSTPRRPRASPTPPSVAAAGGDREALLAELDKLMREQETARHEFGALTHEYDAELSRADEAEAMVKAEEKAIEELQRSSHGARLASQAAAEDEGTWKELAGALARQQAEDAVAQEQLQASRQQELVRLRDALAERRREAKEQDAATERRRRLAADEQCMQLQAVLDFVEGRLDVAPAALAALLGDVAADAAASAVAATGSGGGSGGQRGGRGGRGGSSRSWGEEDEEEDTEADARCLVARRHAAHREEMRGLVALCNLELRRRDRSAAELVDEDGLPRLIATLRGEGLVDMEPRQAEIKADASRTARLQQVVMASC